MATTAPSGPASSRARSSAACGSRTDLGRPVRAAARPARRAWPAGARAGCGDAVKTAPEHFPSSARSMPAASLSSSTETTRDQRPLAGRLAQRGGQRGHPARVVGAVEDRQRRLAHDLRSARHARRPRRPRRPAPASSGAAQGGGRRGARRRSSCAGSRAAARQRLRPDDAAAPRRPARPRPRAVGVERRPAPASRRGRDHGELLARDVGQRRAEPARVLEPDVGEHARRGAASTLVASWRPPRPASTTATSTPLRGQLGERGGGQQLELGDALAARERAVDLGGGGGRALHRRAEGARPARSSSPIRMRSAKRTRCGER